MRKFHEEASANGASAGNFKNEIEQKTLSDCQKDRTLKLAA